LKTNEGGNSCGVRITTEQCPHEEIKDMAHVPYGSVVGSLMYAMLSTRPDISHAVGVLSRYMSTPGNEYLTNVKKVFRYLYGTKYYSILYQGRPRGEMVN
jgi:hypothetical protein